MEQIQNLKSIVKTKEEKSAFGHFLERKGFET